MAIEDSCPTRRNLMATSLAFIAYFFGGGKFESGEISLQVINVKFDNVFFLSFLAWTLLLWFAYRYKQKVKNSLLNQLNSFFRKETKDKFVANFISKKLNEPFPAKGNEGFAKITYGHYVDFPIKVVLEYGSNLEIQKDLTVTSMAADRNKDKIVRFTKMESITIWMHMIKIWIWREPDFADIATPYILFFFAILIPLYDFSVWFKDIIWAMVSILLILFN